jgi:hypothetical protein
MIAEAASTRSSLPSSPASKKNDTACSLKVGIASG